MARDSGIVGTHSSGLVIPASGIYVGAEDQDTGRNFTGTKGIETQLGRRMAIRRYHYSWLEIGPGAAEQTNATLRTPRVLSCLGLSQLGGAGKFPSVTGTGDTQVKSGHQGMDRITAGEWDTVYWNKVANAIKAIGDPVLVNLWYEVNGSHNLYYPGWQGTASATLGSPGTGDLRYRNAFRYVAQLIKSIAPNAFIIWTNQGPTSNSNDYRNTYPGDDVVDGIGVDPYRNTFNNVMTNPGHTSGVGNPNSPQDYYLFACGTSAGVTGSVATTLGRAQGVVKPCLVMESGFAQVGSGGTNEIVTDRITGLTYDKDGSSTGRSLIDKWLVDLKANPNVIAFIHWNEAGAAALAGDPAKNGGNYVDTTAAAKTKYTTFYGDSYCSLTYSGGGVPPPPPNTPVSAGAPVVSGGDAPTVGGVLTVDEVATSWGGTTPITFTFQWYRDTLSSAIGGATSRNYTMVSGDATHQLFCKVTGVNAYGPAVSVSTALTGTVTTTSTQSISADPFAKTPGFYDNTVSQNNTHAGRTWDVYSVNGVVYTAGEFNTFVDNSGTGAVETARRGLTAHRKDTGALITTWDPQLNGDVFAIFPNAANTLLYLVGNFTTVRGASRLRVAAVPILSGVGDTTQAAASSVMPNLSIGQTAFKIVLDEANNRGWIGLDEAATRMLIRIDLNAGAWRISSGFTAATFTRRANATASANVRAIAFDPTSNSVWYGGQNCHPNTARCDGDTGAAKTWTANTDENPGPFDLIYDATDNCVYQGGVGAAGDQVINSTLVGGTNWYFGDDGNNQAICIGTLNGTRVLWGGHHGDVCAQLKSNSSKPNTSHGMWCVSTGTGAGGGIIQPWNALVSYTRANIADGSNLKVFGIYQDADGDLHIVGDFTRVNNYGSNTFRRYALHKASGGPSIPVNTALPTVSDTTPAVGDTFDRGTPGTYTNTPTSKPYAIVAVASDGTETTVATNTSFVITNAYINYKFLISERGVNASGSSGTVRSLLTAAVPAVGGVVTPPAINQLTKPPNPDTATSVTMTWTQAGVVDHWRTRLTTDGVAGAWSNKTSMTATYAVPAGHSYKFEVQAVDNLGNFSVSDSYTWSVVTISVPSAPTILFAPASGLHARSVGFVWAQDEGNTGITWQVKHATPAVGSPPWGAAQTLNVANYNPAAVGTYTFSVRAIGPGGTGAQTDYPYSIIAGGVVAAPSLTTTPPAQDTDQEAIFTWT